VLCEKGERRFIRLNRTSEESRGKLHVTLDKGTGTKTRRKLRTAHATRKGGAEEFFSRGRSEWKNEAAIQRS